MPINRSHLLTIPLGSAPHSMDLRTLLQHSDFTAASQYVDNLPMCAYAVKQQITPITFRNAVVWGAPFHLIYTLLSKYSQATGIPPTTLLSHEMHGGPAGNQQKTTPLHCAMASYEGDALDIVKLLIRNFKVSLFHRHTLRICENPNVASAVRDLVLKCREDEIYNDPKRLSLVVGGYSLVEEFRRAKILNTRITVLLCLYRMRSISTTLEDETRSLWREDLLFDRRFTKGTSRKGIDVLRAYECWESGGHDAFTHILEFMI